MAQVILIEKNKALEDLLTINLTTYVGVEVIPRESANDALNLLSILPNIALVICSNENDEIDTTYEIAKHIKQHHLETGLISFDKIPDFAHDFAIQIDNPQNLDLTISSAAKILNIDLENLDKKVLPDYLPIPVHYFLHLDSCCSDVYIRIKKSAQEYQFVKRIHKGDTFSKDAIKRYIDQNLQFFYIPNEFQKNFTNFLSDRLVKKLNDATDLPLENQIEIISDSFDIAIKEIINMGFNSATVQLTEAIIDSMVKTIEQSSEMAGLLHKLINSKSSYLYQASHMSAVVASECLNHLGLNDRKIHEKMAYAAFFHDISFIDKPELAKISSYEELENAKLNEEDWDLVFNHALEASVLIRQNVEAPEDVDVLIKHHHGALNGKGFSVTHSQEIPGQAKIFLIACEFVKQLLYFKEKGGAPAPIVDELYKKYPDDEMKKVIKALESTLKKKKNKS